jgi:hypothetical protein
MTVNLYALAWNNWAKSWAELILILGKIPKSQVALL